MLVSRHLSPPRVVPGSRRRHISTTRDPVRPAPQPRKDKPLRAQPINTCAPAVCPQHTSGHQTGANHCTSMHPVQQPNERAVGFSARDTSLEPPSDRAESAASLSPSPAVVPNAARHAACLAHGKHLRRKAQKNASSRLRSRYAHDGQTRVWAGDASALRSPPFASMATA